MKNDKIDLHIDARAPEASGFQGALSALFKLVRAVEAELTGEKVYTWNVHVREGSQVVEAMPEPKNGKAADDLAPIIIRGVSLLGDEGRRPDYFSDDALSAARSLAKASDKIGPMRLRPRGGVGTAEITSRITRAVDLILKPSYVATGTVEGYLKSISLRQGNSFNLYHVLDDYRVECTFKEDMIEEVRSALDRRVRVRGMVSYAENGRATSAKVEELRVMPTKEQAVDASEVFGILNNS